MKNIKPVIMAGGIGTRLWPISRKFLPKQFIKIFDGYSLFQLTLIRNKLLGKISVIVSEEHKFIARAQIEELSIEAEILVEPSQKNTAACAIIASLIALNHKYDKVLLLPSDHYIKNEKNYISTINYALKYATGAIVTIGIKPTEPHTGYGYIKVKGLIVNNVYEVENFIEKPNLDLAKSYIEEGNYFWNSGIFIYDANYLLEQANIFQISMLENVKQSYLNVYSDANFTYLSKKYQELVSISVDYALIELITPLVLIKADYDWKDLGNWKSLWEISPKDSANNHFIGDVVTKDMTNSYINSSEKLTVAIGLNNIIVVNTKDATLIVDKSKVEEIKHIVNQLLADKRKEVIESNYTFRSWGHYQIIDNGDLYKVKKIVVWPSKELSLQYHNYRAEHWIIIKGVAKIIIGEEIKKLYENDSIYIPKGIKHKLINIGEIDLHLIEVQIGSYLEEDDITRIINI